jgi:hypothetical protein
LPREQGRAAGVGDGVSVTNRWDRVRGRRERARQGIGGAPTVPSGAVQTGFEIKSKFKWFKTFSNCFNLWSIRKVLSLARKN